MLAALSMTFFCELLTIHCQLTLLTADWNVAGLDEAGRGCLAGPVFAAAVLLPPDYAPAFLNDSKQVTAKRREVLRHDIIREAVAWAVGEASPVEIAEINIAQASCLAIVKKIVERQGGRIVVESAEGAGARFIFTWPKQPVKATAGAPLKVAAPVLVAA